MAEPRSESARDAGALRTGTTVSRRAFLAAGGTGLLIAFYLPRRGESPDLARAGSFQPNAWLQIDEDGSITIWSGKSEMGQGIRTALPMIVAEELDADWSRVRVRQALAEEKYGNQRTTGSASVRRGWGPLRTAGAAARAMLVTAAAQSWGVPEAECRTENSQVIHRPTGRTARYGSLATAASQLPVPQNPPLKNHEDYRIIGRPTPRVDTPSKVDGGAQFGLDVRVPEMRFATVARCPVLGGSVASSDDRNALAIEGVTDVVQFDVQHPFSGVPSGSAVAVIANSTWAAMEGRKVLQVEWDHGPLSDLSNEDIDRIFREAGTAAGAGQEKRNDGNAERGLAQAATTVEATYEAPYLAHACMEPMNCTADVRPDRCVVWAPTQNPQGVRQTAARLTGLSMGAVTVHTTFLGGGFGRRSGLAVAADAIQASRLVGKPVQVCWTREDDIRHGYHRPRTYHVMRGGLDTAHRPVAWSHRLVGPPGGDWLIMGSAARQPYAIPNVYVEKVERDPGVPYGPWRAVGESQSVFVIESFIDELAHAAGADPYQFRRALLSERPRLRAVLDLVALRAGWGMPLPPGRHRGIALCNANGTFVAEVAEVSVDEGGSLRVHRVIAAVDCGTVINPNTVEAQAQSSIIFGLTAALYGEITVDGGRIVQGNFNTYEMLRMRDAPDIEVHIVESHEAPGGMGEPALPPIAPAVTNAIFAAVGKRVRKLPVASTRLG